MINSKKMYLVMLFFKFLPPTKLHNLKSKLLRWAGVKIGKNVEFSSSAKILGNGLYLEIGDNCYIGHEALIFGPKNSSIIIEDYAKIGTRAILVTGAHRHSIDGNCIAKEGIYKNIKIGRGAVVSTGCIIQPGIFINNMSYVAPGSIVTKEVPSYTMVGGVPAKKIKEIKSE